MAELSAEECEKKRRSRNMAAIKCRDTSPELIIRLGLFHLGFRYRICCPNLPGKPDIVLKKYKAAIFVNGCFWHRHKGCPRAVLPHTHREYWLPKIERNVERDQENIQKLKSKGWRILIVWECALKKTLKSEAVNLTAQWLKSTDSYSEITNDHSEIKLNDLAGIL